MDSVILAHGSGVDDLIVFASTGVVVLDIAVADNLNVYPMVPSGAGLKEMILN